MKTARVMAAPPRTLRKRERTRGELVVAAEGLIALHGMEAISIDDITRAADVAKGTFYTHFSDKNDLALAIARHVRDELEQRISLTNQGLDDAATRMANGISTLLAFAIAEPVRARALVRLEPGIADPGAPHNAGLRGDIVLGMKAGRFAPPSADAALTAVLGIALSAIVRLSDTGKSRVADPYLYASEIVSIVLLALGLKSREANSIAATAMNNRRKEHTR